jgi:hypothetical protein
LVILTVVVADVVEVVVTDVVGVVVADVVEVVVEVMRMALKSAAVFTNVVMDLALAKAVRVDVDGGVVSACV